MGKVASNNDINILFLPKFGEFMFEEISKW